MPWVKSGDIVKKIIDGEVAVNTNFTIDEIKDGTNYTFFYSIKSSNIDTSTNNVEIGATLNKVNYNTFNFSSANNSQVIKWGCAIFI